MNNLARGLVPAVVVVCALAGFSEAKAVVAFSVCGINDNDPGDLNPVFGVIEFSCVTGTGSMRGTAERTNLTNYHKMVITNAEVTGTGSNIVVGAYTLGTWVGPGYNRAWTIGTALRQTGGGYSDANSNASTFGGADAYALALLPPGTNPFGAIDTTFGTFGGTGVHTGTFTWDATDGAIRWPDSDVFEIGVPEPAAWAMMIMGFGLVGVISRRRRAVGLA